jgi:hypothetical protein
MKALTLFTLTHPLIRGGTLEVLFADLLNPPQLYNWFTDPTLFNIASLILAVLGIVIAIIGIGIGYWLYLRGKKGRRIIYEVISDTPIVSVPEQTGRGKIKVTYKTMGGHIEEINDARLLTLKVWNEGNGDVIIWNTGDKDVTNLEEPIQFEFERRTVVGLTHIETDPPGQVIQQNNFETYLNSTSPSPTCLSLPRCQLKQNQSIQLGILLNGPSGNIKLKIGKLFNGEIVDIHKFDIRTNVRNFFFRSILGFLVLVMAILLHYLYPSVFSSAQIFTLFIIIVVVWAFLSAFAPFRCTHRYCGYKTWNPSYMLKHVVGRHSGE